MLMSGYPVHVRARRDSPPPGRWLWLVKWLLLVPHYVVLFVLWTAFAVLTLFAYIAVLITGRYPQSIFEFNVGVLRWTWRVRSEEHTSELQSRGHLVCRLLLEKKKQNS